MKLLCPKACDFMVYKDYKNRLNFVFPVCGINFRIEHLTCSFMNHRVTIHHNIFRSPSHSSFLIVSSINLWWQTCWSMICCFRSSSRHAIQTGVSEPKIISLHNLMVSLIASSSSSFVFIQLRGGIFNSFASSNRDDLFIYL